MPALIWTLSSCENSHYNIEVWEQASPIIDGVVSTSSDYPATGAIIARTTGGGGPQFGNLGCTATLIAPDTILTAAHCTINPFEEFGIQFEYFFTFELDVSAFESDPSQLPPGSIAISSLVPHPDFSFEGMGGMMSGLGNYFDIGLGYLSEEVTTATPAVIMQDDDASFIIQGEMVEIAGYGTTTASGETAGIKYHATTVINEVAIAELQIGNVSPTPQKCHGDSGGPTYLDISDGLQPSQRIISVTSRAYDERDCEFGGVDTRVDFFRTWLSSEMVSACSEGRRLSCSGGGAPASPGMGGPSMPVLDAGFVDSGVWPDAMVEPPLLDAGLIQMDATTSTMSGSSGTRPRSDLRRSEEDCACQHTASSGFALGDLTGLFAVFLIWIFYRRFSWAA